MNADKLILRKPSVQEVLDEITPFVIDPNHEERFAALFDERKAVALQIIELAQAKHLDTDHLRRMVSEHSTTVLSALISLLGISQEEFYRHVTLARYEQYKQAADTSQPFREWRMDRITREILNDHPFAGEVFQLLLAGKDDPSLAGRIPEWLLQKLDGQRLASIGEGGVDALIRTGLKGSYDAGKGSSVVAVVEEVLDSTGVSHHVAELTVPGVGRQFDALVPHENDAASTDDIHILIEVGVFATTARELSEKGLVEELLYQQIKEHYPEAVVVRVLDGVGWIARGGSALSNVINASDYVFTQKTLEDLAKVVRAHVPERYFNPVVDAGSLFPEE